MKIVIVVDTDSDMRAAELLVSVEIDLGDLLVRDARVAGFVGGLTGVGLFEDNDDVPTLPRWIGSPGNGSL